MTERKKLSLTKAAQTDASAPIKGMRKPPVRGAGSVPRKRLNATEAALAREEAAAHAAQEATKEAAFRAERIERQAQRGERTEPPHRTHVDRRSARPTERPHAGDNRPRETAPARSYGQRQDPRQDNRPPPSMPAQPDDGRIRLSKLMSERGIASRREADEWIEHGWVSVNGEVVAELGSRVLPDVEITIDATAHKQQSDRVTILINKPMGYVSGQAEDGYDPAVVLITPDNRWAEDKSPLQLTRGHLRHLAPAGRLDIDSTGLLVLTQDGRIAKHLIGENSGVEKEYLVRVQAIDAPDIENIAAVMPLELLERLRFGLELDGHQLRPAQVSWQNEQQLRFVLREGRKRQIRRMCELVGLQVVGLRRVRIGSVTLSKLPLGQWRFLRPEERF